ncbi:hypothetical protein QSK_0356, partial [Clostridioides difficile P29]
MGRVLVDSGKILIHPKTHACDKHHPQRNHGFLMCAYLDSTHLFFFWFFDSFSRFLILIKHIFQVLSIVLLVLHRLSAVASNYCLGLHILSGHLHGTSGYFLHKCRRGLHTNQRYRWNGRIPSPQPLPARVEDVGLRHIVLVLFSVRRYQLFHNTIAQVHYNQ